MFSSGEGNEVLLEQGAFPSNSRLSSLQTLRMSRYAQPDLTTSSKFSMDKKY